MNQNLAVPYKVEQYVREVGMGADMGWHILLVQTVSPIENPCHIGARGPGAHHMAPGGGSMKRTPLA